MRDKRPASFHGDVTCHVSTSGKFRLIYFPSIKITRLFIFAPVNRGNPMFIR